MTIENFKFKVVWSRRFIGIGIDKLLKENKSLPITTFFFWPSENGWELLKAQLNSKPWISNEESIEILNGYNNIIKYWLKHGQTINQLNNLIKDSKNYNFDLVVLDY